MDILFIWVLPYLYSPWPSNWITAENTYLLLHLNTTQKLPLKQNFGDRKKRFKSRGFQFGSKPVFTEGKGSDLDNGESPVHLTILKGSGNDLICRSLSQTVFNSINSCNFLPFAINK